MPLFSPFPRALYFVSCVLFFSLFVLSARTRICYAKTIFLSLASILSWITKCHFTTAFYLCCTFLTDLVNFTAYIFRDKGSRLNIFTSSSYRNDTSYNNFTIVLLDCLKLLHLTTALQQAKRIVKMSHCFEENSRM